jgi:hypothetical protein
MKKMMICLALLVVVLSASAQTSIKLNDGKTFVVDLSSINLDSIHSYVGVELAANNFDVSLSNIVLADGITLHLFGAFVDSAFRPQLAWLDVPESMVSLFPAEPFSEGSHINISYICADISFYLSANLLFNTLKKKGDWEVVLREKEVVDGEEFTELQTVQLNGRFPTSEQFMELSLWR